MTDSKIIIGADVRGVTDGVTEAKLSIKSLADTAESQGRRAGSGLDKVGTSAGKAATEVENAAKKQERATRSIISSIEREIAAQEAGGRHTAGYYEALAKHRGADIAAVQQYTNVLKKQENQLKLNNITVGQYNNAMRMAPAQFTDIITQLAGGQNPFLIAIQQGGQLRDSFGGFGNMMKGMLSFISPLKLGIAGVVGGVGALALAMYKGAEESRAYEKALILTGNQAGTTAGQLQQVAAEVGSATGGYAEAREAVIALASSGKVGAENFSQFTQSIVLQSQATGQSVDDLVAKYVKIAEDPLKAVVEFSGVYRTLTADVYAQVKALKEQGREQEAVTLVLKKYSDESTAMAERVSENLGLIERGWIGVTKSAAAAWDLMKNIGRQSSAEQEIEALNVRIRAYESRGQNSKGAVGFHDNIVVEGLKRRKSLLEQQIAGEKELAAVEAGKKQREQESISAMKYSAKLADEMRSKEERFQAKRQEAEKQLQILRSNGRKEEAAELARSIARMDKQRAEERAAEARRGGRTPIDSLSANQKKLYALAQKYGEDPAKWLALYQIESASGKNMLNRQSGATGHFQIMPQFFRDYGVNRAGANDLETSFAAVRGHHARGSARLKSRLGRDLTSGEYYLGHQQGWGGATALLSNPDKNVVDALATIMSEGKAKAAVTQNGGRTSMTARQFANMWIAEANKLQEQYAGKGIGGMDSESFDGIGNFTETPFDKWLQNFTQNQEKARIEADLTGKAFSKTITQQLALLSNPDYESFSEQQKQSALEKAKNADAQADINKITEKYRDILKGLNQESERDFDDDLFELSLIGKKTEEIERLTAARRHDKLIKEAMNDGAGADVIAQLQTAKLDNDGRIEERQRLAKEQQSTYDADWLGGIKDGMDSYRNSFDSMRDSMSNAVVDTMGGMTDALADFVATGKGSFRDFTASVLQDLSRILVKMAIMKALQSALGGYANGGVVGADGSGLYGSAGDFGGWSGGGYTGAGGKYEPAGIVHKGEVVFSQADVQRHGGVERVESLRLRGYADGGIVGRAPLAALNGVQGGNTVVNVTINRDGAAESSVESDAQAGKALGAFVKAQIEEWAYKNMSRQGQPYYRGA